MSNSLNLTALTTNLGAYVREARQEIFSDILLQLEAALSRLGITVMDNIKDELPLVNFAAGNLVAPGNYTTFNSGANKLNFGSRTLKVRPYKVDLLIFPQEIEATWLTQIRKSKGTYNADNFPLYEYMIAEIVKKISRELRFAVFAATYNGAGTTWADIVDGLLKLVTDDVTAGNIIEVTTGAVTSSNIVESVEKTVRGLGDDYKDLPGVCIVSPTLFEYYISASESAVGRSMGFNELSGNGNGPGQMRVFVRGTNVELIKEPSFASSQRIFATTEGNMIVGMDSADEHNNIKAQEFERSIKLMVDGKIGVNYKLSSSAYKPISVNDQA